MLATVLGLSACGPKADEVSDVSSEPSLSTEAEAPTSQSTETADPSAPEDMEVSDVVESSEVVEEPTETAEPVAEEVYFEADKIQTLIEDLTAKYSNMNKKQVQAAILVANYDHITQEDWDALLAANSVSEEELNDQFIKFVESYQAGIWKTARYYMDKPDNDKEAYNQLIKFEEFALAQNDIEVAKTCDEIFSINAYRD